MDIQFYDGNNNENDKIYDIDFENKFDDEFFKICKKLDKLIFEDDILVSNYGEIYNKTQNRQLEILVVGSIGK